MAPQKIVILILTLLAFNVNINYISCQDCEESYEWSVDSTNNFTCTYQECTCEPTGTNGTLESVCTKYPVNEQSSMDKFKSVCSDVANAGCTNVEDLRFFRCGTFAEACTLFCGCNNTLQGDELLYYTDVDVYSKTCYSCDCDNANVWDCGDFQDSVNINDNDWDTWTCGPAKELECYSGIGDSSSAADETCTNNETFCIYQSYFSIGHGTICIYQTCFLLCLWCFCSVVMFVVV